MTADHLIGIEQFEADLWKVADNLRANSNLASNEYFMPILGLIFLRHATNRYYPAMSAIEEDKATGKMPDRPLVEADFTRRRALMLPEPARYFVRQADWLQERFPEAELRDVEGLVKLVDGAEVAAHDWSLTPGRYVGVAPAEEDESFDFEAALRSIHMDLKELNDEAAKLATRINRNFEEVGV